MDDALQNTRWFEFEGAVLTPVVTSWLLALALGARHASEPDHIAAVSTMLAEQPEGRRGMALGAVWGVGHALALLVVGGALFALHSSMPRRIADAFELGVALMLLFLGARSVARAVREGRAGRAELHSHGGRDHVHAAAHTHVHVGARAIALRPLAVGLVHGLAGSGALTVLALASMPTLAAGFVYIVLFGVGSIFGMALLTGFASLPLRRLAASQRIRVLVAASAGVVSIGLGVAWGWPLAWRLATA